MNSDEANTEYNLPQATAHEGGGVGPCYDKKVSVDEIQGSKVTGIRLEAALKDVIEKE